MVHFLNRACQRLRASVLAVEDISEFCERDGASAGGLQGRGGDGLWGRLWSSQGRVDSSLWSAYHACWHARCYDRVHNDALEVSGLAPPTESLERSGTLQEL